MIVCVDTQIWLYAYGRPKLPQYLPVHIEAKDFLNRILKATDTTVALSLQQAAEILQLLGEIGVSSEERIQLLQDFSSDKFLLQTVTIGHLEEALRLSMKSSVHIWDYLVALPLRGIVQKIYSADKHFFRTDHFSKIAEVSNPLSWEMVEGKSPEKRVC